MRVASSLVLALAVGCASPSAPTVVGVWGGREASLVLTQSGGTVAYACGAGTIGSGWTLDAGGAFNATGEHYFGGGPAPVEGRTPHPVRYTGQVTGDVLSLTVTLLDLGQTLGPFHLVRGGPPVHELCV